MKETKMKMYVAPAVKVVAFTVEHGFAGTTVTMDPQADATGNISEMNVTSYNDWEVEY